MASQIILHPELSGGTNHSLGTPDALLGTDQVIPETPTEQMSSRNSKPEPEERLRACLGTIL
jgi:hypothetical protein